tara:strand:- start:4683 stop:5129 length:447 start_codon:yes stop_codon:yes gene_type:complete
MPANFDKAGMNKRREEMRLLKRLLLPVIFVLSTTVVAHALPCDNRGSNWQGRIDIGPKIWGFELRRQTCAATSPWNYYLWTARGERFQGQATVTMNGRSLLVSPYNGGAAGCALSGTWYPRDTTNGIPTKGRGSASCGGSGTWSADIR